MKKFLSLSIAIILISLCACGTASPAPTPIATPAPTSVLSAPAVAEIPEPTPQVTPSPAGEIFLTVSSITFSLVGESESIYAGSAPLDAVNWRSEDESVISVDNGVLTATGVGSTTVYAEFQGQQLSCTAGCLAATGDELKSLKEETLRSPKRIPPVMENPPLEYFDETLIIGDSITLFLFKFESVLGELGNPLFLTRGGTSLLGIVNRSYNIYYQGQDLNIEDSVASSGAKRLFIMLGQNDLGYRTIEDTLESYKTILDRIRGKSPDVEIYLQSVVHEWAETRGDNSRNEKIDLFNTELIRFAEEQGCHYVDIQKYTSDHTGRMAESYSMDHGIHLNEAGCTAWMHALNAYAHIELMGENQQ